MKLIKPDKRPLTLAVTGMARSGSTIIASFFNSLDGGFIVGEPHSMMFAERPYGADWPVHIGTRYGDFVLERYDKIDVLQQIQNYAFANGADIYGFKDVWTQNTNPLDIVSTYGDRLDYIFVVIREPRAIYQSTIKVYRPGQIPPSPITFIQLYNFTLEFCTIEPKSTIVPISYELFIRNPTLHISEITGWEFEGDIELSQFPGAGDAKGKTSKVIDPINPRKGYEGSFMNRADILYEEFLEKFPHLK